MNYFKRNTFLIVTLFAFFSGFSQDSIPQLTNIQQYTPSKLIGKGQVDIKWFNNLYTETESTFAEGIQPRQSFFTSTLEFYTGVGKNKRLNLGFIARLRSNIQSSPNDDRGALDVFNFSGETGVARSGLTALAPSIKFVPFPSISNFSIQSSFFIPLIDNETEDGILDADGNRLRNSIFLEQNGFAWQNRLFYDYTFPGNKWQLFTELTTEFNFGKASTQDSNENTVGGSFANNSLNINPGVFISYFPSSKFTVLALAQHSQRLDLGNNFAQDFTALGGGAKYQLTNALNFEVLYTNFVRGNNTGLGQTFNFGVRGIF
ncbi:hypothetical protein ACFQZJ_15265 [Maribacter chungangensis]|uniref:Transporter n=1 Tax=Maribacter chungangensis TaxID=1069117 RepID=A0ABW3B7X2_9FLAO